MGFCSLPVTMLQRATRLAKPAYHHYRFTYSYTTKDESKLMPAVKVALQDAINLAARKHEKVVTLEHCMSSIMKRDTLARKTMVKLGFRTDMVLGCLDSLSKARRDPWYTKLYQILQAFSGVSPFEDWFPRSYVKEEEDSWSMKEIFKGLNYYFIAPLMVVRAIMYIKRGKPNDDLIAELLEEAGKHQAARNDKAVTTVHLLLAYSTCSMNGRELFGTIFVASPSEILWAAASVIVDQGDEHIPYLPVFSMIKPDKYTASARKAIFKAKRMAMARNLTAVDIPVLMESLLTPDIQSTTVSLMRKLEVNPKLLLGALNGYFGSQPKTFGLKILDRWYDDAGGKESIIFQAVAEAWSFWYKPQLGSNIEYILVLAQKIQKLNKDELIDDFHIWTAISIEGGIGKQLFKHMKKNYTDLWKAYKETQAGNLES